MKGLNSARISRMAEGKEIKTPKADEHRALDLAFSVDCTGSMGPYIETVKTNIRTIVQEIVASEKSDIRMALVEYRDHPPQDKTFVTRVNDFTPSLATMKSWLESCTAEGGGDTPEAVADALQELTKLSWRSESAKICVCIMDAPPHGLNVDDDKFPDGCPLELDPMILTRELAEKGITLYTVGCEPAIMPYKEFFTALAYLTGGQYVPLRKATMLTRVIIGGAREELSLERWMAEVDEEVQQQASSGQPINEGIISESVFKKLKTKGVTSLHLSRNKSALGDASEEARRLSALKNLAEVRRIFKPLLTVSTDEALTEEEVFECLEGGISYEQSSRLVKKSIARSKRM